MKKLLFISAFFILNYSNGQNIPSGIGYLIIGKTTINNIDTLAKQYDIDTIKSISSGLKVPANRFKTVNIFEINKDKKELSRFGTYGTSVPNIRVFYFSRYIILGAETSIYGLFLTFIDENLYKIQNQNTELEKFACEDFFF